MISARSFKKDPGIGGTILSMNFRFSLPVGALVACLLAGLNPVHAQEPIDLLAGLDLEKNPKGRWTKEDRGLVSKAAIPHRQHMERLREFAPSDQ